MKNKIATFLLITTLLVSCVPKSQIEQSAYIGSPDLTIQASSTYPVDSFVTSIESPYPIGGNPDSQDQIPNATEIEDSSYDIPVVNKDFASVYGVVKSTTNTTITLDEVQIYIATIVPVEPDGGFVYSIQQKTSPHAITNQKGQFAIDEITPGKYVMILVTPIGQNTITNESGETIFFNVKAGDVINFGDVYVAWP